MVFRSILKLHLPSVYHWFLYGKPSDEAQIYDNNTYLKEYIPRYRGRNEEGLYRIEQRTFPLVSANEVMKRMENIEGKPSYSIVDEEGNDMESRRIQNRYYIWDIHWKCMIFLRRKE